MKTLPIIPKGPIDRALFVSSCELPLFYMNDYSMLGLQVSPFAHALNILMQHQYVVSGRATWAELVIRQTEDIQQVILLLMNHGIQCQMTDMVTALYQG